jgi:hypothetical protein
VTRVSRRAALRLIGAAPLAAYFGVGAAEAREAHRHASRILRAAEQGHVYAPKFFTPEEWQLVRVLVDLILPRDERSGSATDAGVPEFMDFLMSDPEQEERARESRQTAMRGGLAWIDAESRSRFERRFVDADESQRKALLDEIAWVKADRPERESQGAVFFSRFRNLTASGFWSSELGVVDLGYVGNRYAPDWAGPPPEVLHRLGVTGKQEKT